MQLQFAPELRAGRFRRAASWRYCAIVCATSLRRFVEEFDAEIPHAQLQHARHIFRARLRERVENRVAAADIGFQRMFRAHAVAQFHVVLVAGRPQFV